MKLAVAIAVVLAVFPLGWLAGRRQWLRDGLVIAIGALAFTDYFDLNPISYETYRGVDRGLEITIIDLLVWSLGLALPRSRYPVPYRASMALYLVPALLSVALAPLPLLGAFSVWKLLRTYLLIAVLARAFQDATVPPLLLRGLAAGLVYQAGYALFLRYVEGHHQVAGTFSHQNTLGMAVNLVVPVMFALVLRDRNRVAAVGVLAGAVCVVLTLSRGALTMLALGLLLVYVASLFRGASPRKLWVAVAGAGAALLLGLKSFDTILSRFLYAPTASAAAREQFNEAASLMLADHPFGVGLNMYSHMLENAGYAEQVGITGISTSSVVHNIYWLTLAETGYLGLIGYLALAAVPVVLAVRGVRRAGDDVRGDVLLGLLVGLVIFHTQGLLEWAARQTVLLYLFGMMAALSVALWRQLRDGRTVVVAPLPGPVRLVPTRTRPTVRAPPATGYAARWGLGRRNRA